MYCITVNGKKIRILKRFLRVKTKEFSLGDPFYTHLDWAYVIAAKVHGTVLDQDGNLAPRIRHMAKIELYDYSEEEGGEI